MIMLIVSFLFRKYLMLGFRHGFNSTQLGAEVKEMCMLSTESNSLATFIQSKFNPGFFSSTKKRIYVTMNSRIFVQSTLT